MGMFNDEGLKCYIQANIKFHSEWLELRVYVSYRLA
jgi:hypothetical protein